jgi:hypothetical protein
MHNVTLALQGAWKVLAASLILGAGLPLIFALGIRSLAWGSGGDAEVHTAGVSGPKANPAGTALGWTLFIIVLAGVALGITFVVATGFGKVMSFDHIYPTIHSK